MSSYIPEGTHVICTNMTNGAPLQIGLHHTSNVLYKSKGNALLNIEDKKISASFSCKNTSKFWSGFATLALGIAVGAALVAAVVLTGGAAGIAIAAAAVAAGTATAAGVTAGVAIGAAIGFGITSHFKQQHACDITLQSNWLPGTFHATVKINKQNALLNTSLLQCKNGGTVSIIVDYPLAVEAAKKISENNIKELHDHEESEFFMGVVGGVAMTAFPSAVGLLLGGAITSYDYVHTMNDKQEKEAKNESATFTDDLKGLASDNSKYLPIGSAGDIGNDYKDTRAERIEESEGLEKQSQAMDSQASDFAQKAAARQAAGESESSVASAQLAEQMSRESSQDLARSSDIALQSSRNVGNIFKNLKWGNIARGFGIAAGAAIINFFIDGHFYDEEKDLQRETREEALKTLMEDEMAVSKEKGNGAILAKRQ